MDDVTILELQRAVSRLKNPPAELLQAVADVEGKMRFWGVLGPTEPLQRRYMATGPLGRPRKLASCKNRAASADSLTVLLSLPTVIAFIARAIRWGSN